MDEIVKPKRLVIFDKDGTLCKSVVSATGKSGPPNRIEDQDYFDDVKPKCEALIAEGCVLAVASNQGGVAFGIFSADEAELLVASAAMYIRASAYRVCFFHPKGKVKPYVGDSWNRKPNPGMIESLMTDLGFKPSETVMVGDWDSDRQAAAAAGVEYIPENVFFKRDDPFADRLNAVMGNPS